MKAALNAPWQNVAKMVGQTECDEERIGDRSGAKDSRQHNIAKKPVAREASV